MELTPKISPFQFFTILFLSRIFAMVTYVTSLRGQLSATDEVIQTVIMSVILFVAAVPTFIFIKQDNRSSIITRAECVSKIFSKILCVIFLAAYLYFGMITAVRFGIFTGSVMFPDTNVAFFIFVMVAASAFIATKGTEAMGRSAAIILIPVIIALLFVFVTQIGDFDILNFTAPFTDSIKDTVTSSFYTASRTGELAFVLILMPFVKNQKGKHLFAWLLAVTVTIVITETMLVGILGNFGSTQLFNMYSMSVLAEFGFIERLDAIITCIWLLCAGVKISITVFLCENLLTSLFGKKRKILYTVLCSAVIFAFSVPIGNSITVLESLIRSPFSEIFFLMTSVLPPVAVMMGEKIKRRRKIEKI